MIVCLELQRGQDIYKKKEKEIIKNGDENLWVI